MQRIQSRLFARSILATIPSCAKYGIVFSLSIFSPPCVIITSGKKDGVILLHSAGHAVYLFAEKHILAVMLLSTLLLYHKERSPRLIAHFAVDLQVIGFLVCSHRRIRLCSKIAVNGQLVALVIEHFL